MTSADLQADASYALLALFAEDMYRDPAVLEPPADPRLARAGLTLVAYLTGADALYRPRATLEQAGRRVYYGFIARSSSEPAAYVIVVRGTQGIIEWIEDAEFCQRAHPVAGKVEAGFFGIYQTLMVRPPGGADLPLPLGLRGIVTGQKATVIGHSLGAAMATYLALDAALLLGHHCQVSARLFASPHPGDTAFANLFASQVPDSRGYAYAFDLVPKVPFLLGYTRLTNVVELGPEHVAARIRTNVLCCHHALCYASMLDYAALEAATSGDQSYADCVLGALPTL